MARIRTIKPEFWSDEKISPLDAWPELLFIGLWNFADDMGRMPYSGQRLANQIFPGKGIGGRRVDTWIQTLAEAELIQLYTVDGHGYLWIPGFTRHQKIDKPGHSTLPAHPKDRRDCKCPVCKGKLNGKARVPAGTHRIAESWNRGIDESEKERIDDSPAEVGSSKGSNTLYGKSSSTTYIGDESENDNPQNPQTEGSQGNGEDRRTQSAALEEIARKLLAKIQVPPNPNTIIVLTKTIQVKARNRGWSIEAAANHILAKAAVVFTEAPPDDWVSWFFDARYEYVPQGDTKLTDRRIEARATCGGTRCQDGWEAVGNGSRRCSECVRLWEET